MSNIPFDERGFPIFDSVEIHRYDFTDDPGFRNLSRTQQTRRAARRLAADVAAGRVPNPGLSSEELRLLAKGKALFDYVWHHPGQHPNSLQLVKRRPHFETGHIGSVAMQQGR